MSSANLGQPRIRKLGLQDYAAVWHDMQQFNSERTEHSPDELWIVQHPPVFTLGLNGKSEHVLNPGNVPVIPCDRGGQVTYHGPGQWVYYILMDLRRSKLGVKTLVTCLEQAVIDYLAQQDIHAQRKNDAPGVYVNDAKIAALGLRIKRGCSYHGLSFNIDMDLGPFSRINPCGYPGLSSTQLKNLIATPLEMDHVELEFTQVLLQNVWRP
ncbi:MAG: lipoyl(octanoyl) transferase LipB [Gammaproteobacteria bacterium]|nr:lipoyl(octanoyl) transferase LipB [Gammaproteobacteria bacterium]MDH5801965.1 lipoyl(octanoyl) transferase LipB [Gammaproteobacteria bacterium]